VPFSNNPTHQNCKEVLKRKEMLTNLLLEIELVPKPLWFQSLRSVISKADWDKIRHETYFTNGNKCGVCKANGKLECHELWQYDDIKHIQKLMGTIALCNLCHHVKHIGLAGILADEGKLDYDAIVRHFMKINNCTEVDFDRHYDQAFDLWEKRSKHKWTIAWGKYNSLIKK
jgi:hypothetical protein